MDREIRSSLLMLDMKDNELSVLGKAGEDNVFHS